MRIDLTIDVKKAASGLRNYQRRKLPRAIQQSINRTAKGARTEIKNEMAKHINLKKGEIHKRTKITQKATRDRPEAIVEVFDGVGKRRQRPPNLIRFVRTLPKKLPRGKMKGAKGTRSKIRVSGKGVRAKEFNKTKTYKKTFAAPVGGKGNQLAVFKRIPNTQMKSAPTIKRGKRKGQRVKREQIKAVWGPRLTRTFTRQPKIGVRPKDVVVKNVRERFRKEFNRQVARIKL